VKKVRKTRGHRVTFTIPHRPLGKADVTFDVALDDDRLGELLISKGAVVWFPAHKKYGYKLSWSRFDRLAVEHGTRGRGK
jgi:hypothetical protein